MWYNYVAFLIIGIFFGALTAIIVSKPRSTSQAAGTESAGAEVSDWAVLATGTSGWIDIEKAWLRKAQELYGIFCKKQHDYGPTNIAVGGLKGVAVRVGDKTSRLWELSGVVENTEKESGTAVNDESLRDTLFDLADYGIIGALVYDGDWPLMSVRDVWGPEAIKKLITE